MRLLKWVALILTVVVLYVLRGLAPALVLAAWAAHTLRPLMNWLSPHVRGQGRASAAVATLLVLTAVTPVVLATMSLAAQATTIGERVLQESTGADALRAIVVSPPPDPEVVPPPMPELDTGKIARFIRGHARSAWGLTQRVLGITARVVFTMLAFVISTYAFLAHGAATARWLESVIPLRREHLHRFAGAFFETGRGLFVALGLTAVSQGTIATITYLLLDLPSALVLGFITTLAAFLPAGATLVWGSLAAGLMLLHRSREALTLVAVGVALIGQVDNVLRPYFARLGRLRLPPVVLMLSMLGATPVVGAWGLLVGPLLVRIAYEAFAILREEREHAARAAVAELSPPSVADQAG
jgi:predicted PurR-regulated permease PerM